MMGSIGLGVRVKCMNLNDHIILAVYMKARLTEDVKTFNDTCNNNNHLRYCCVQTCILLLRHVVPLHAERCQSVPGVIARPRHNTACVGVDR